MNIDISLDVEFPPPVLKVGSLIYVKTPEAAMYRGGGVSRIRFKYQPAEVKNMYKGDLVVILEGKYLHLDESKLKVECGKYTVEVE